MRQLGFARLAALLVVLIAVGPKLAVTAEGPAAAPAFAQETPMACPSTVDAALGDLFIPHAHSCVHDEDCFEFCCRTFGCSDGFKGTCGPHGFCLC